jgi:exonuclease SbcC
MVHEITKGRAVKAPEFVITPYRPFKTVRMTDFPGPDFVRGWVAKHDEGVKDCIVRVWYTATEEEETLINRKEIAKWFTEYGAYHVQEVKPEKIIETLNKIELDESSSPEENLIKWAEREGLSEGEIDALVNESRPLIATVSAGLPSGQLSGLFMPKKIAVTNYRSYLDEVFDLTKVHYAMVNGTNGVGKSALFMDAVKDCLYEKTREADGKGGADVNSWINNKAKSGAITFEFMMGDIDWRVTRTRSRSGKATLSLQAFVDGHWEDRGGVKQADTQKAIINLLGMDAETFQSCAMIMQDAYGRLWKRIKLTAWKCWLISLVWEYMSS